MTHRHAQPDFGIRYLALRRGRCGLSVLPLCLFALLLVTQGCQSADRKTGNQEERSPVWVHSRFPASGTDGTILTLQGVSLNEFLSVHADDVELEIVSKTDDAIEVRIPPALAPGEHRVRGVLADGTKSNVVPFTQRGPDTWLPVTGAPGWRVNFGAVWTGREMIVWGGATSAGETNTGSRYNPVTDSWLPMTQKGAPMGRQNPFLFWTGSRVMVFGGYWHEEIVGDQVPVNTVGLYDPAEDDWQADTDSPEKQTESIAWAWVEPYLISLSRTGDSTAYDLVTRRWITATGSGAPCLNGPATIGLNGLLYVYDEAPGEWDFCPKDSAPSFHSYDITENKWRDVASPLPSLRNPRIFLVHARLYIVGNVGSAEDSKLGGFSYDVETENITILPSTTFVKGPIMSSAASDHQLFFYSGGTVHGLSAYDLDDDSWRELPAPGGTGPVQIVWSGEEVLAWGPALSARFSPEAQAWSPMAGQLPGDPGIFENVPGSQRNGSMLSNTSVSWTGSEFLVWTAGSSSGTAYDPATERWTPLPAPPQPVFGYGGATAWTGEALLVCCGADAFHGAQPYSGSGELVHAASFDPASRQWDALPDAPSSQGNAHMTGVQSSVWTGSKWLLFYPCESVRALDVAADHWDLRIGTCTNENSTEVRAVWTGANALLWAGKGWSVDANTLAFSPLPVTNAPEATRGHSAVWTGTEMIVWGGYVPTSLSAETLETNGGKRFHPASNTWKNMVSGSWKPSPREGHLALWTGTEMFVWGGEQELNGTYFGVGPSFADGALYDPASDGWRPASLPPYGDSSGGAQGYIGFGGMKGYGFHGVAANGEVFVWGPGLGAVYIP